MKVKAKTNSRQCETNRQEVTILDSRRWKVEEDDDDLGLFISAAKTLDGFWERLDQLQNYKGSK